MALTKEEKEEFLQSVVLKQFSYLEHVDVGALIVDTDYIIRASNELCRKRFGVEDLTGLSNITIYESKSGLVLGRTDTRGVSFSKYVDMQNKVRLKLHEIVINDGVPVQFACFMPHKHEFISLLVHYMPIFHPSGEVVAIQVLASNYNFWGLKEYMQFLDMKPIQQLTMLSEDNNLPIKLSMRQHEILFLLTNKIPQRQAAEILDISYGNLSKIVREVICPKFGINDANVTDLIILATKKGYCNYIPQSLCRPCVIILDYKIWEKYFNDISWSYPHWLNV